MNDIFLCEKKDILNDSCKGFSISEDKDAQDIFIVNRSDNYYAYKNSCPHTGVNLNWQPDVFMDYDNFYIQCSVHAARFEVETGFCVWGPCANQSLKKVDITITQDKIFLKEE